MPATFSTINSEKKLKKPKSLSLSLLLSPSAELHSTSCGNPGIPPKAVLSGGGRFAVGDRVRYSCVPGYVLDGHATLTCITNAGNTAVWDFPAPICRGMDD